MACPHQLHALAPDRRKPSQDGHEEGADVLINDGARVTVSDVLHGSLGASETPARAFAAPEGEKAGVGGGALGPDRRGGRNRRRSRRRQTAAIRRSRKNRERRLGRKDAGFASRSQQVSGRTSRPTGAQRNFLGHGEVLVRRSQGSKSGGLGQPWIW